MNLNRGILYLTNILLLMLAPVAARAAAYHLKAEAVVHGPSIKAAEVLEPAPDGPAAMVVVGTVGKPGSVKEVARDLVALKLSHAGAGGAALKIEGTACKVTASKQLVSGKDLLVFGKQYLVAQVGGLSGTAKVDVEAPPPPADLSVPDRTVTLSVSGNRGQGYRGRVFLRIVATQAGDEGQTLEVGSVTLSFLVKVVKPQLTALRSIARGERISPENSVLSERDVTYVQTEGFSDTATAQGLAARRQIGANAIILPDQVELPMAVKRGDLVRVTARSKGVSIDTAGKVLRDGRIGDTVPVMVLQTKKEISAIVTDSRSVRVDAP